MPFYKIGHASLLGALHLLHPGVEVPTPEQLSVIFLDRAHTKVLTVTLTSKVVTFVTDGWTYINGQDVVNYVVVCGEFAFFLESVYTGTQAHDTEFLSADVERVIAKYDFLEDIVKKLKWMATLQSGCKTLVSFFKKHYKMWADLTERLKKDLRVLAKPGDTRQRSRRWLVESSALRQFEKNETPISEVYQIFVDLPTKLNTVGLAAAEFKIVKALMKSCFDFIYGDAHGIAYLLDPRYAGLNMDSTVRNAVEKVLVARQGYE
ncbi:hypothetical protein PF007_g1522 [Phytophthora fragariae]|uniref:Uncharacterized protein n=1 Tax=Phytophthora fragariae TaxID=53985 RepID=A0A6A3TW05_9STRA|nr:hypothetical protein PF007_g1522 [Phytophthora fragariae]